MPRGPALQPVILDSITKLTPAHTDRVVVTGSHGGVYPGFLAACGRLRAVIFSDAGIGLDGAGIGALPLLGEIGVAAAAVDYRTARIGDGADLYRRGLISHANGPAVSLGCRVGEPASVCAEKMQRGTPPHGRPASPAEGRMALRSGPPPIWGVDSNSLLTDEDQGALVVSGSHGGLLGGNPATAIGPAVLAAAFNDAGRGIDDAGISRLPALERRGIAAVTVSAWSARIGDARSSWMTGIISACNVTAARHGAQSGMKLSSFLIALATRIAAARA